jgi:hypothetical protein
VTSSSGSAATPRTAAQLGRRGQFEIERQCALDLPGEYVAIGTDKYGQTFIVYAAGPSAQQSGIPVHAFATAIVRLFTPAQILGMAAESGAAEKLAAACVKTGLCSPLPKDAASK